MITVNNCYQVKAHSETCKQLHLYLYMYLNWEGGGLEEGTTESPFACRLAQHPRPMSPFSAHPLAHAQKNGGGAVFTLAGHQNAPQAKPDGKAGHRGMESQPAFHQRVRRLSWDSTHGCNTRKRARGHPGLAANLLRHKPPMNHYEPVTTFSPSFPDRLACAAQSPWGIAPISSSPSTPVPVVQCNREDSTRKL